MFSWIPVIGPIVQGLLNTVSSIYGKFADTKIEQIKGDTQVDTAAIQSAKAYEGDRITIRIYQDILLAMPVAWPTIYGWDQIVAIKHPELVWPVLPWPPELSYLPYMAAVYLLGATGLILWKRK